MITDFVPELLTSRQRAQLILGLRARVRKNSSQLLRVKYKSILRTNFIVSGIIIIRDISVVMLGGGANCAKLDFSKGCLEEVFDAVVMMNCCLWL